MSYSISISGHKDVADAEQGRAFEEKVARKARAFVAALEGVNSAQGSFGHIGAQDLRVPVTTEPAPDPALAPPDTPETEPAA